MSDALVHLIFSKIVGKTKNPEGRPCTAASRKAVLIRYASRANDDGSSIFTSKERVAAELEVNRSTVITATQSLLDDGLMRIDDSVYPQGKRPGRNGFTYCYRICVSLVRALPDAWSAKCRDPDTLDDQLSDGDEPIGTLLNPVNKRGRSVGVADGKASKSGRRSVGVADMTSPYRNRNTDQLLARLRHDEHRVRMGNDPVFKERDAGESDKALLKRIRDEIDELTSKAKA